MNEKDFIFSKDIELDGIVKWTAPSNIAIVKYWGKLENQIPQNPSISLTLNESITTTSLSLKPKSNTNSNLKFEFEWETNKAFEDKTSAFFKKIDKYFPFILNHDIEIKSKNNFPHSSGIASSASSMAALSACLVDFEKMNNSEMSDDFFYKKASFISRIGSGSASRSIYGPVVIWGESKAYKTSNDLFEYEIRLFLSNNLNYNKIMSLFCDVSKFEPLNIRNIWNIKIYMREIWRLLIRFSKFCLISENVLEFEFPQ